MSSSTNAREISVDEEQEILLRARSGDRVALGQLYRLHLSYVISHARRYLNDPEQAEDLAQDAFVATCDAMERGKGPKFSFGHYWMTAVRSIAITRNVRGSREILSDAIEDHVADEMPELPVEDSGAIEAFLSLSKRRQQAVWLRAVQGYAAKDAAIKMGLNPAAFSALYVRAKEEMRLSYLLTVDESKLQEECKPFFAMLPASVRNSLRGTKARRLRVHLTNCESCRKHEKSMLSIASRFAAVLPAMGIIPAVPDRASALTQGISASSGKAAWLSKKLVFAGLGSAIVVTSMVVIVLLALSSQAEVLSPAQTPGKTEPTLVSTIAGPEGECSVTYVPGTRSDSYFLVENKTGVICSVGIQFDGKQIREAVAVQKYEVVMAPRSGTYSFALTTPHRELLSEFDARAPQR